MQTVDALRDLPGWVKALGAFASAVLGSVALFRWAETLTSGAQLATLIGAWLVATVAAILLLWAATHNPAFAFCNRRLRGWWHRRINKGPLERLEAEWCEPLDCWPYLWPTVQKVANGCFELQRYEDLRTSDNARLLVRLARQALARLDYLHPNHRNGPVALLRAIERIDPDGVEALDWNQHKNLAADAIDWINEVERDLAAVRQRITELS